MNRQKKFLLCMYVDNFCGIKEESFNFYIERRYAIEKGQIRRKSDEEIENFPNDFWEKNISAVTLLIGENGAGKTTLMRLLIKWLCQLSAGHIPQEKGALIISVDEEGRNDDCKNGDKLIAFDKGSFWEIKNHKGEEIVCIANTGEIKELLKDIRLAYYTDTMTDLELSDILTKEELAFLQDDSLLTRLSNSIKSSYTVDSIKDCIKREDFVRQMKLFLDIQKERDDNMPKLPDCLYKFPIRYMKLTAKEAGSETGFEGIPDGNSSLVGEAIDLWKKVFDSDINHSLSGIARALLWGLFSGTIISMLQWERTFSNVKKSVLTEKVRDSLRAYIRNGNFKWDTVFKHFFTNLFNDCEKVFNSMWGYGEFQAKWNRQVEGNINSFLDVLKNIEQDKFLEKWMLSENAQNIWEFKLEHFNEKDKNGRSIWIPAWAKLWKHYQIVAHLMPGCRFDWKYASSGEINKTNLYCTMQVADVCECSSVWFLLDEPDNSFHLEWKRKMILEIIGICLGYNINFQMLIATHSPIMLSDVPRQAAILLKAGTEEIKRYVIPESSPFGQQIYTLFRDAFFMEQGVIGAFANVKISATYNKLVELEKNLKNAMSENGLTQYEKELKDPNDIIKLIDEPLLRGHLLQHYNWCSKCLKRELYKKK